MVFNGKEGIHWYFLFSVDEIICMSNHAFLVCFKYKCHIKNFLLTSLARYIQRNIGPRVLYRYFSVQTSRSVNKKLLIKMRNGP